MNISWKLAWRGFIKRRQTWLLCTAVALCMMSLLSIGLVAGSIFHMMEEAQKDQYGEQMILATMLSPSDEEMLASDENFTIRGRMNLVGTAESLWGDRDIQVGSVDAQGLMTAHLKLNQGRFPEKENEIAIEKSVLARLGLAEARPGEIVSVTLIRQDGSVLSAQWLLSGIVEDYSYNWFDYYTDRNDRIDRSSFTPPSVFLSEQKTNELTEVRHILMLDTTLMDGAGLFDKFSSNSFSFNYSLYPIDESLAGSGVISGDRQYYPIQEWIVIAATVLVAATIAIVLNAFLIILEQRKDQIRLLRTIGASAGQARLVVLEESLLCGLFGIAAGLLFGTLVSRGMVWLFAAISGMKLQYYYWLPLIPLSAILSMTAVLAGSILPVYQVGKVPPLTKPTALRTKPFRLNAGKTKAPGVHRLSFLFIHGGRWKTVFPVLGLAISVFAVSLLSVLSAVFAEQAAQLSGADIVAYSKEYGSPPKNGLIYQHDSFNAVHHADWLPQEIKDNHSVQAVTESTASYAYWPLSSLLVDDYISNMPTFSKRIQDGRLTDMSEKDALLSSSFLLADAGALQILTPFVSEGIIHTEAVLCGEEAILYVPDYVESGGFPYIDEGPGSPSDEGVPYRSSTYSVGDTVTIVSVTAESSEGKSVRTDRKLRIGAIIRKPITIDYEPLTLVIGHEVLKEWNVLYNSRSTHIYLKNSDEDSVNRLAEQILSSTGDVRISTLHEARAKQQQEQKTQMTVVYFILFFILIVCCLGFINSISNRIHSWGRQFLIFHAVGLSRAQVIRLFAQVGLFYGFLASVIGMGSFFLLAISGILPFDPQPYIAYPVLLALFAGTQLFSILCSVIPGYHMVNMNLKGCS